MSCLEIVEFFGIKDFLWFVFVLFCIYVLNFVILGLDWSDGDVVIMSGLEYYVVFWLICKVCCEKNSCFYMLFYVFE